MDAINFDVLITVVVGVNIALLAAALKLGRPDTEPGIEELPWPEPDEAYEVLDTQGTDQDRSELA